MLVPGDASPDGSLFDMCEVVDDWFEDFAMYEEDADTGPCLACWFFLGNKGIQPLDHPDIMYPIFPTSNQYCLQVGKQSTRICRM